MAMGARIAPRLKHGGISPLARDRRRGTGRRLCGALAVSFLLHALVLLPPHTKLATSPTRSLHVVLRAPEAFELHTPPSPLANHPANDKETESALRAGDGGDEAGVRADPRRASGTPDSPPPLPAVTYYTTDQLTRPPHIDRPPLLNPPELEGIAGSGTVVLRLWISAQGDIVDTVVEKSSLPEIFGRTAAAAFRLARFLPGELNGVSVRSTMRVEVDYDRRSDMPHVQPAEVVAASL